MMDGRPLFPGGFHPSWKDFSPKLDGRARALKRRDVDDVKYFFIDFGISSFFDDPSAPRLVKGLDGLDKTPRELYGAGPYDPFLLDVYILGNVYRKAFINVSLDTSYYKSPLYILNLHFDSDTITCSS